MFELSQPQSRFITSARAPNKYKEPNNGGDQSYSDTSDIY